MEHPAASLPSWLLHFSAPPSPPPAALHLPGQLLNLLSPLRSSSVHTKYRSLVPPAMIVHCRRPRWVLTNGLATSTFIYAVILRPAICTASIASGLLGPRRAGRRMPLSARLPWPGDRRPGRQIPGDSSLSAAASRQSTEAFIFALPGASTSHPSINVLHQLTFTRRRHRLRPHGPKTLYGRDALSQRLADHRHRCGCGINAAFNADNDGGTPGSIFFDAFRQPLRPAAVSAGSGIARHCSFRIDKNHRQRSPSMPRARAAQRWRRLLLPLYRTDKKRVAEPAGPVPLLG